MRTHVPQSKASKKTMPVSNKRAQLRVQRTSSTSSPYDLRRLLGNRMLQRMLQPQDAPVAARTTAPETAPDEGPETVSSASAPTGQRPPTPEEKVSGRIPNVVTPPGEGRVTESEEANGEGQEGEGNVVADLQLNFIQPKADRTSQFGGKNDSVESGVAVGAFSQPGGRAVSPFGSEFYEPAFTGISYAFAGGKCKIAAKLDVICPWGTNAGGRIDVPAATAPVVTRATWRDIRKDLKPRSTSPFKSRRRKYYSQALVERHEKFHGTDDQGWTTSSGLGIVKTFLEASTVTPASAAADVSTLLDGARTKLISENMIWYKGGGTAHDSYAGEIRAYGDGRAAYQQLADNVRAHGKSLKMKRKKKT